MATPHPPEEEATTREAMEQQPFVDRHWLWHNGLRRETVLDYFAQSRFYDRASCNEELRMQGAIDVRAEHLKGMTGLQYLAEEVPGPTPDAPIFVIQKLLRTSAEQEPQVLDVYYVLNGVIYQAPTIFSVLNARLRRCAHMLNTAQKTLRKAVGLHGFHQQAGQAGYPDISMAGRGGAADLYSLKRGRGGGGRGSRGGRGGRGGKRAKQAAQQYQLQGYEASPMLLPPPPMHYGQGGGEYYPPLRGEEMVLMDMDNLQHHPSPLPSPHGGNMVPPPPPPAEGGHGQPPFPQSELPPRLISRYPGPSPLTEVMTGAHPDAAAAAEKMVSGVVEEAAARQGGGSTSSHSTAATAGMGPAEAAVGVSGREEI